MLAAIWCRLIGSNRGFGVKNSTPRTASSRYTATDHRLRWDDVVYAPGELRAVAYKNGAPSAESVQRTDGRDLAFVTARVVDASGVPVPPATLTPRAE